MTCSNGQILKVNAGGTAWECAADAGASGTVADLNGQTGSVSVATSVSSGVDAGPTVSAAAGTVTVNIPLASDAASTTGGLLTNAEYTALDGKLDPTLTDGNIFVGNGSNVATGVAMSGDATMDNTGALTIANDAVSGALVNSAVATCPVGYACAGGSARPVKCHNDETPGGSSVCVNCPAGTYPTESGLAESEFGVVNLTSLTNPANAICKDCEKGFECSDYF